MAIQKTEAIVLKTYDFRETSKIAVFFTRDFGKIKGILKGARTEPQKFGGFIEPLKFGEMIFYKKTKTELNLVTHFEKHDDFTSLKKDLKTFTLSSYIMELIDYLMPLDDKNPEVFTLTLWTLENFCITDDADKIFHIFVIKALMLSGFRPHLDSCLVCGRKIQEAAKFNFNRGGLVCLKCGQHDRYPSKNILRGTIATICHIEDSNLQEALRLGIGLKIRGELYNLLTNFLSFHLEKRPHSARLLKI
ncbi:MAG: DNA repair protein RecO [Candidatus Omnitrophota bacterium]